MSKVLEPLTGDSESALRAAHVLWAGVTGITMLALREKLDHTGSFSAEALTEDLYSHYLSSWAATVPAL